VTFEIDPPSVSFAIVVNMTESSRTPWSLDGRRALVTGGTRGIGAAVAACFVERGARVLVTARAAPEQGLPDGVAFVGADVASGDAVSTVVEAVDRVLGGIDILVHGVGASFMRSGGSLGMSDSDWQLVLETNLLSAVRLDRALLPGMVARGRGAIVHVSSLQWKRPHPSSPAYGPAKAALTSYSKMLANEFAPAGIRINTVTPGFIATSGAERRIAQMMAESGASRAGAEAKLVELIGGVPLGRAGTAAEVAEVVAFVVSDAGSYLSGAELTVDGGNCSVI
jgi:NAD(P)-dependent dehydrogenase (short-subunit alcohol dehydrogenase family)